jgi:hypothetical protein
MKLRSYQHQLANRNGRLVICDGVLVCLVKNDEAERLKIVY